ncbi:hypothetical protein DU502_07225 [Haloplanus aerogenes]|uniref:Uncharacterized protein n=1 Tax=Haloplanus aerogenes TaxID=660522 RepID=A0A3G8QUK8_9EURY|nr:hypothetical protein DU502_07225 [Haloplanus aerogenes]
MCDAYLRCVFADRSFGPINAERDRSLRITAPSTTSSSTPSTPPTDLVLVVTRGGDSATGATSAANVFHASPRQEHGVV